MILSLIGYATGIVALITALNLALPTLWRPDNLFGVTVAPTTRQEPAGRAVVRGWMIAIAVGHLALLALTIAGVVWLPAGGQVIALVTLPLALIGYDAIVAAERHRQALAFALPGSASLRAASLRATGALTPLWAEALPLALIAATAIALARWYDLLPAQIPIHWGSDGQPNGYATKTIFSYYFVVINQVFLWGLFVGLGMVIGHARMAVTAGGAALRRALGWYLYALRVALIGMLGGTIIVSYHAALTGQAPASTLAALPLAIAILAVVGAVAIFARLGQSGWRRGPTIAPGDGTPDGRWYGGMIYYNPADPAILVERRMGLGYTLNMARWQSWLALLAIFAVPLALGLLTKLAH